MKKLLILLFSVFFLLSSPSVFADDFIYHCNLETYYKNSADEPWDNKYIKYTYTLNNDNTISIFNHGLGFTSFTAPKIYKQNSALIIALYQDSTKFNSLVIDRLNSYGTYSISYTDGYAHGQYGTGECILQ